MSAKTLNNKNGNSDGQLVKTLKRVTTVEKKMAQMRDTLKKYPIPPDLLEK